MRLPYIPDDPEMSSPEDQAVVNRVKERRGGKLIPLDKALLHAPPIADGWNSFLKSVRTQNSIPDSIRELCMSRVAALNQAWFEWESHAPLLRKTNVLSEEAVESLKDVERTPGKDQGLDEKHAAVAAYTDAMTTGVVVKEPVFERIKSLFSDREVVEITATISELLATLSSKVCRADFQQVRTIVSADSLLRWMLQK